ncbi:hypothetical protein [Trebonia kvetii]|uniref:hypothetical protein n=1 Tax=Trebonia kvetii TaxID=2480626 RepID=UPI001C9E4C5D|nr:hypothetical protein [Trebonia kvetii]
MLALKAALLNLFSIGAAYGVIVAVFQWGWGGSLLGVSGKVPIESVPDGPGQLVDAALAVPDAGTSRARRLSRLPADHAVG